MFNFTVIMPMSANMDTVLRLLGTYKIILKRKNHRNTMVQFYYIGADFLVLWGHVTFMKLVFTASDNVHSRTHKQHAEGRRRISNYMQSSSQLSSLCYNLVNNSGTAYRQLSSHCSHTETKERQLC